VLTVADLAGVPSSDQTYLERSQISESVNHLHSILKQLATPVKQKEPTSKIYKELHEMIHGNYKINVLAKCEDKVTELMRAIRMPLMKAKKTQFNKMFIEYDVYKQINMQPQIKKKTVKIKSKSPARTTIVTEAEAPE
jgi:hypothetical protein